MSAFLYFVPEDPEKPNAEPAQPDAGELEWPGCPATGTLPSGSRGNVCRLRGTLAPGGTSPMLGYYPGKQEWAAIQGSKLWLGWERDHPPTPADLQRETMYPGHVVTMADGQEWTVPIVQTIIGDAALPTIYGIDANGALLKNKVLPAFERLWDLTRRLYAAIENFDVTKITEPESVELLCSALALNYRVARWEVLNLGLLTVENKQRVFGAMIDFPQAALLPETPEPE